MNIDEFNQLDADAAVAVLRPALDIPRWSDAIVAARPFGDRQELLDTARTAAEPLTESEIDLALAHHPRIGDRPDGDSVEAGLSRSEQQAIDPDDAALQRDLTSLNVAYEKRFGRVFLIRAAGRTPAQILAALEERLHHSPDHEIQVVAEQLRQIAVLRLEGLIA